MKEIPLSGKVGAGKVVLVDDEDFEWLSQYRWYLNDQRRRRKRPINYYYADTAYKNELGKWKKATIHQFIMGKAPSGHKIDHIDRNTLNNQRCNLRIVSNSVSQHNQNVRGKSKFRGVYWVKSVNKWRSLIRDINNRRRHLGNFTDETDAAQNYDFYALLIHGDEAAVNFPNHDYTNFTPKRIIETLIHQETSV